MSKRILVVEDQEDDRQIIRDMLADALGDGQSQAGAAFLAADCIVGLLELLKQLVLVGSGDARSGVTHRYVE